VRHRSIGWFAVVWAPFVVWWLAEYPGEMWVDSFTAWREVTVGPWTNHHPAPFVAVVWLTTLGGHSVATATLAQSVAVAAALTYLALTLSRCWSAGRAPLLAAAAMGWLPLVAPFALILQKDAWELAAVLVVAAQIVRLASARDRTSGRTAWVGLFAAALSAALMRWNGAATDIVTAVVVLLALTRGVRSRAFVTLTVAGLAGLAVLLAIPHVFDVRPVAPVDSNFQTLADLGNYAADRPSLFTAADRAVLGRLAPFSEWQRQGGTGCDTVNYIVFRLLGAPARKAAVGPNMHDLSALWRRLVRRDPATLARLRICRAALAWSPVSLNGRPVLTLVPQISPNRYGITAHPVLLGAVARSWADVSARNRVVQAVAWRPAVWVVLAGALLLVRRPRWARSKRAAVATALAVPLGVLASYAVAPAAQDARYGYPATLVCQLFIVAAIAAWRREGQSGVDTPAGVPDIAGSTISKYDGNGARPASRR
jgi:hypothetical protein